MINFTKTLPKEKLMDAINELQPTDSVDAETLDAVKAIAIARVKASTKDMVYISIRIHCIPQIFAEQIEIQLTGK